MNITNPIISVNFHGYICTDYQHRSLIEPPKSYISNSFKIFLENELNSVRIPVYWEPYEKVPQGFSRVTNNFR